MAISTSTVWEVRTGGNANNGGGFKTSASGTDYSQQNSPQYALTGIASSGSGNTILSAAAAADMVGNIAQAISGTNITAGFYEVVSVSVGVSITFSTNNSSGSICTGVAASGVINIGGAIVSIQAALNAATANNVIYVKGGTAYTVTTTTTITLSSAATPGNPLSVIGYTTTRGDGGQATWTTATNSTDLIRLNGAQGVLFQNLIMSCTAGTPGDCLRAAASANAVNIRVSNCVISGWLIGIEGDFIVDFTFDLLTVENTEIKSCTSHGVQNIGRMWFTDCFIHDNAGAGIIAATAGAVTGGVTLNNCIFYQNGASGVSAYAGGSSTNRAFYFKNCNFSKNTGAGLLFAASSAEFFLIWDCIFDANTTYGIDGGSGGTAAPNVLSQYNNAFFNNTTAARRNMVAGVGDVTLSVSPYTSLGTDFSLNNTAGGGAACRGAGVPGVSPAGTGFIDIGALQHQDAGGATTVYVINQQISRYTEEGQ